MRCFVGCCMGLVLMSSLVVAQPPESHGAPWRRGSGPHLRGPGERGPDAKTRDLLEKVMMARVSEELSLDDGQTVVLVRRFGEIRGQLAELRRERKVTQRQLAEAVKEGQDGAGIEAKLNAVLAADIAESQARQDLLAYVGEGLTAWQRAKLYLFIVDFEADIRRMLMRAQERRGAAERRGGAWASRGPGMNGHKPVRAAEGPPKPPRREPPAAPSPDETAEAPEPAP